MAHRAAMHEARKGKTGESSRAAEMAVAKEPAGDELWRPEEPTITHSSPEVDP